MGFNWLCLLLKTKPETIDLLTLRADRLLLPLLRYSVLEQTASIMAWYCEKQISPSPLI